MKMPLLKTKTAVVIILCGIFLSISLPELISQATEKPEQITLPEIEGLPDGLSKTLFTVSPDWQYIIYLKKDNQGFFNLFSCSIDGTNNTQLTQISSKTEGNLRSFFKTNPFTSVMLEGKKTFVYLDSADKNYILTLSDFQGKNKKPLKTFSSQDAMFVEYSLAPSGKKLFYAVCFFNTTLFQEEWILNSYDIEKDETRKIATLYSHPIQLALSCNPEESLLAVLEDTIDCQLLEIYEIETSKFVTSWSFPDCLQLTKGIPVLAWLDKEKLCVNLFGSNLVYTLYLLNIKETVPKEFEKFVFFAKAGDKEVMVNAQFGFGTLNLENGAYNVKEKNGLVVNICENGYVCKFATETDKETLVLRKIK